MARQIAISDASCCFRFGYPRCVSAPRTYRQHCGLAAALDLLGERWTMLIVRELSLRPKRFGELEELLPGLGTNLLSARLKALEEAGVVRRALLPPPARVRVYELDDRGRRLEPVLDDLALWGYDLLPDAPGENLARASWIALSMRAAAGDEPCDLGDGVIGLDVAGELLVLSSVDGHLRVRHGVPDGPPTATLRTDLATFYLIASGALTLAAAKRAGQLEVDGDSRYAAALLRAYPLPERAAAAA